MKRTDVGKVTYPQGTSAVDRQFVRKLFVAVGSETFEFTKQQNKDSIIIACSAGLDSTVLVHAITQWYIVSGQKSKLHVCYVNHHLRSNDALEKEEAHVRNITPAYADFVLGNAYPNKGPGLQDRARQERYSALTRVEPSAVVLTAHTLSDVAETKLFQFVTGRHVSGIPKHTKWEGEYDIFRPLLSFTREDIEQYAKVFNLTWCEDVSNSSDDYTRNKIRHNLIPYIKEHINPAFEHIV